MFIMPSNSSRGMLWNNIIIIKIHMWQMYSYKISNLYLCNNFSNYLSGYLHFYTYYIFIHIFLRFWMFFENTNEVVRLPAELNVVVNKLSMHKTHWNRLMDNYFLCIIKHTFNQFRKISWINSNSFICFFNRSFYWITLNFFV